MTEDVIQRFGGIARLYGERVLEKFLGSHVAVVGIGGVGSWTVEALARSGVGKITMVDLDEICVTNINRQLHAMDGNIGVQKTEAMQERVRLIHPSCEVVCVEGFYSERSADVFFEGDFDFVVDAIDRVKEKVHLLDQCKRRGIGVISCGGAGGLRDPSKICVDDMARVTNDALIAQVRSRLRSDFGFPKGDGKKVRKFGLETIFSTEQPMYPQCDGSVSAERPSGDDGGDMRLNCASGYGSITHMTATVGLFAAERALQFLAEKEVEA